MDWRWQVSASDVIEIVWDGDVAIAVNKPAGLPTQAPGEADSLETRLRRQLDRDERYLAFPHRLDRPVSGLVLVALRKSAAKLLSDQFVSRKVKKLYLAEVRGEVCGDGVWEDWLRKVPDEPRAVVCGPDDPGAKRAETHVGVIGYDPTRGTTRMQLMPVTGRMHQLRLQAASRKHPIVGDPVYGPADRADETVGRIMLHAHSLEFHDPRNGSRLRVVAGNDAGMTF